MTRHPMRAMLVPIEKHAEDDERNQIKPGRIVPLKMRHRNHTCRTRPRGYQMQRRKEKVYHDPSQYHRNGVDEFAEDIGEAEVAVLIAEGETLVIHAQ